MDLFELVGTIAIKNSEANQALDDTANKGQETQSKLGRAFSAVGKGAAVVGKTIATGLVVGGTAMAGLTVKAMNLAGDLEQNMGGSNQVFAEYAGQMQETARDAFANMGLSTSDYLGTANKMGALFQGAGFSIEESMNLSSSAMQRAADVASIMGLDTGAAMEAIAGAAKGNFTMMDNLGVAMNDTALQAYALEKGINKSTSEMTQQEKIGLAMEMFMDKTAYAAGNYAKENETLAGSLGTAKAALTNFLDGSGGVDQLVTAFSNATNVIVRNVSEIAPRLISGLSEVLNQVIPMIPPLFQELLPVCIEGAVSLIESIVAALPAVLDMLVTSALPMVLSGIVTIFNSLVEALPGLVESLCAALPTLIPMLIDGVVSMIVTLCTNFSQIIQPIIDILPSVIISVVDALMANLPTLISGLVSLTLAIVEALPEIIMSLIEAIPTILTSIVEGLIASAPILIDGVKSIWNSMVTGIQELLNGLLEFVTGIWTSLKESGSPIIQSFMSIIETRWTAMKNNVTTVVNAVKNVVITVWESIKNTVSTVIESIRNVISTVWNAIKTVIANVMNIIFSVIKGDWDSAKQSVINIINAIKSVISSVWNAIKATISSILSGISSTISSVWNGIKSTATSVWNGIKSTATSVWNGIKTAMTTPIETAKTKIKGIVDAVKGFFTDMKLEFPNIKLPHFSVTPAGWKIGDLLKGTIPSLGIEWYAKAMDKPMIMTSPTIFGYNPATGTLMGGGEAGSEVVTGTGTLMNMIGSAVNANTAVHTDRIIVVLTSILDALMSGNREMLEALLAGHTLQIGEREFGRLVKEYA